MAYSSSYVSVSLLLCMRCLYEEFVKYGLLRLQSIYVRVCGRHVINGAAMGYASRRVVIVDRAIGKDSLFLVLKSRHLTKRQKISTSV